MDNNLEISTETDTLATSFNKREDGAFAEVYLLMYKELNNYANRLFIHTEIDTQDLVQDVFLTLWTSKKLSFINISHIKNYLYLSIRNKYRNYLKHKVKSKHYADHLSTIEDYHFSNMVESEVVSLIATAENILPPECAKTFKLFMEGYEVKEISDKLNKSMYTIYHQKTEAVKALKKYLGSRKLYFFSIFF